VISQNVQMTEPNSLHDFTGHDSMLQYTPLFFSFSVHWHHCSDRKTTWPV